MRKYNSILNRGYIFWCLNCCFWYYLDMYGNPSHMRVNDTTEVILDLNKYASSTTLYNNRNFKFTMPLDFIVSAEKAAPIAFG